MFYEKLDNIDIDKFSGMSFGLNPMNQSFSLLHSLFHKGKIEHLKIAFEPTSTAIGDFYIGGLPQSVVTNKYEGEICLQEDEVKRVKWFNKDSLPENISERTRTWLKEYFSRVE